MLKGAKTAILCIVVVLVCVVPAVYYHSIRIHEVAARYRYECPMHLRDLWDITMALAKEGDRFPEDLTSITNKVPISQYNARWRLHPVLCPGSQTSFDFEGPTTDSFGYVYVNWSSRQFAHVAEVPAEYPLIYDRALSNHLGRGIFVLKVNGSVIWDSGAEWIRGFTAKHPEYHIPLPQ